MSDHANDLRWLLNDLHHVAERMERTIHTAEEMLLLSPALVNGFRNPRAELREELARARNMLDALEHEDAEARREEAEDDKAEMRANVMWGLL